LKPLQHSNADAQVDGTPIDAAMCESLKVYIYDEEVTLPQDEYHFPTYGTKTIHPEITEGKNGSY
jgi:hypothetical protein